MGASEPSVPERRDLRRCPSPTASRSSIRHQPQHVASSDAISSSRLFIDVSTISEAIVRAFDLAVLTRNDMRLRRVSNLVLTKGLRGLCTTP